MFKLTHIPFASIMEKSVHLKLTYIFFFLSGHLQWDSEKPVKKLLYKLYKYAFLIYYYCLGIATTIELRRAYQVDIAEFAESLMMTIFYTLGAVKAYACQYKQIHQLLIEVASREEKLLHCNDYDVRSYCRRYATFSRNSTMIFMADCFVALGAFIITGSIQLFIGKEIHFPFRVWMPFEGFRYFQYVLIALSGFICVVYLTAYYSLIVSLITHVLRELKIIQHYLINFDEYSRKIAQWHQCSTDEAKRVTIKSIIIEHIRVISFVSRMNKKLQYVTIGEFLTTSLLMGACLTNLSEGEVSIASVFTGNCFTITLIQVLLQYSVAQEIVDESVALSATIFETNWYEQNETIKRCLLMMIMRSQKALTVSVGPLYVMSNSMSIQTFKACFSYITLFSVIKEAQN